MHLRAAQSFVDSSVNNPNIQRYRRMSGELKNQKFSLPNESSENPNCYIHFSDGKNITVSLKEGMIVNDLLKDVASYHGVDNQVSIPPRLVSEFVLEDGRREQVLTPI